MALEILNIYKILFALNKKKLTDFSRFKLVSLSHQLNFGLLSDNYIISHFYF